MMLTLRMAVALSFRMIVDSVVTVLADREPQYVARFVRVRTGGLDRDALVLAA
jgi:hypothetical protein